ncbi:hypothetical protein DMENIID0001_084540 [Sergentomyia squamirostris]
MMTHRQRLAEISRIDQISIQNSTEKTGTRRIEFEVNCDVTFTFSGDHGDEILAKKSKLVQKSEVFQTQFASGIEGNRINITDISFETFNELIKHIYEKEVQVRKENFLEIFYASRKYFVNDLILKVIKFIESFVQASNLGEYFADIDKFDIKTINDHILNLCARQPIDIVRTLNWSLKPQIGILKIILESPILNCSEYELYREIMQMIEKTKGDKTWKEVQKEFGKMIFLIRFPTMTVSDVIKCGKEPTLLSEKQAFDILLWIQEKIFTETLQFFSTRPRIQDVKNSTNANVATNRICPNCRGRVYQKCSNCSFSNIN